MIPDPGRASKAVEMIVATASPFDGIRIETLEGREYWSARDLMPLLGYERWESFADAINRAQVAAYNSGVSVSQNFPTAAKVFRDAPKNSGGRPGADYHLSRYACYLVALNGDPRKPEIAAAQTYFVVKTREAEVRTPQTREERFALALSDAQEMLAEKDERIAQLSSSVVELSGPASSWNELAEAAGDYSVADAAKVLARGGIKTGERRLFYQLQQLHWVYKPRGSRYRAYQDQIDLGRLTEKIGRPFYHAGREELVNGEPTVRITPKGLQELHKRLGGKGEQLTLAVAE